MRSEIKKWGNSAAIRLPGKILAEARLGVNRTVSMVVMGRTIIIEAVQEPREVRIDLPYSEADLVRGLASENAHAELLTEPLDEEMGD